MAQDANKRKAAKKKNKAKANKKSASSNAHGLGRHHHGDSDRSQHKSPRPTVKTEKKDNNLSGNESSTTEKTEMNVKETDTDTDTDRESNPYKPNEKNSTSRSNRSDNKSPNKKKSSVTEPASVAEYLAQPIHHSSPQKGSQKVQDFKPIHQSLVAEQADQNQTSINTISDNSLMSDSRNVKCPYCGKTDDDGVKEPDPPVQCSEKQTLLDSSPREIKKSSWKSCCGICDLFSGSSR